MDRLATDAGLTVRAVYHYFPSKRELFTAATTEAFERFGLEVAAKVFVHENLRDRVRAYIDVYRSLHHTDPHVLSFIGMVLVDAISDDHRAGARAASPAGAELQDASLPLKAFLEALVDHAMARGEVHPDVDREGAMLLLETIGMGLSLAALNNTGAFPQMLDAFDRLADGSLFSDIQPHLDPRANAK